MRATPLLKMLQKRIIGKLDTAYALDTFNDHGSNLAIHDRVKSSYIIQRNENNLVSGVKRRNDLGIVCCSHGARRTAMKTFLEGDHFSSSREEGCHLQGILVCLRARVAQKQ